MSVYKHDTVGREVFLCQLHVSPYLNIWPIVHVLDLESQFVSLVFASSCIAYNALFCVLSVSP